MNLNDYLITSDSGIEAWTTTSSYYTTSKSNTGYEWTVVYEYNNHLKQKFKIPECIKIL